MKLPSFLTRPLALLLAGAACCFTLGAHAQAGTQSLLGWSSFGDVSSQSGALILTTAWSDEVPNHSGIAAESYDVLAAQAGVAATAFDLPGDAGFAYEGALARQSFSVLAGQKLSFQWSFASDDSVFDDHAFAVIDGMVLTLATRGSTGSTVNQSFSHTFTTAGTVSLALGVVDTGDVLGVSTLSVQNLAVAPVPEPETVAMLLAGLGVIGLACRRRARTAGR